MNWKKTLNEPHWLKGDAIASIVMDSLFFNDNKHYSLLAACIMSNHVHVLIKTLSNAPTLNVILQNHKKFTAVHSNKNLHRSGAFWAQESFDTLIGNDKHFYNTIYYIIQNPVKAGIVKEWTAYQWNYLHPELDKEYRLR